MNEIYKKPSELQPVALRDAFRSVFVQPLKKFFQRPLTWSETERLKIGIPPDLFDCNVVTLSIHLGGSYTYHGEEHMEFLKGSVFEQEFLRFEYFDIKTISRDELEQLVFKLGERIQALNQDRADVLWFDTSAEVTETSVAEVKQPPFIANLGFYPAMDGAGEVISAVSGEISFSLDTILTCPFSSVKEAQCAMFEVENRLIGRGIFSERVDIDTRGSQRKDSEGLDKLSL
jgi:hypothetical protein